MDLDIEKFSPTKAELRSLAEKAGLITKDSSEEEIHDMRRMLRSTRTNITSTGKAMRENAIRIQKEIIAKEKELVAIISPEEERIAGIEEELEIAKQREARRDVLPQRKARIEAIEDGGPMPSDDFILDLEGTDFEGYLNERVAAKNRKEQERIDAEKRRISEEKAKLEREKEIEQAKQRAAAEERERLDRQAREKDEREAREKKEAEAREARERERIERESRYQEFLAEHGYNTDTKHLFHIERSDAEIKLYKLVGTLKINQNIQS